MVLISPLMAKSPPQLSLAREGHMATPLPLPVGLQGSCILILDPERFRFAGGVVDDYSATLGYYSAILGFHSTNDSDLKRLLIQ
jgi:hypothetical protein